MTVSIGSDGWTVLTPSGDSRLIYVSSSSGSDSNNGLSTGAPKQTLAAAKALLRSNNADWILLKKGDTWTGEGFGVVSVTTRSAQEPLVITSYGSGARPKVNVPNSTTFFFNDQPCQHIAITGIDINAYQRDPADPAFLGSGSPANLILMINNLEFFLFEDNKTRFIENVIQPDPAQTAGDLWFRRNVILDNYRDDAQGHAQGLFIYRMHILLEENVFDHNGWHPTATGAFATIFNHQVYFQVSTAARRAFSRGNIFARSGAYGASQRCSGMSLNNLFLANAEALILGAGDTPAAEVGQSILDVVLHSADMPGIALPGGARGWGIELAAVNTSAPGPWRIHRCLNVHSIATTNKIGFKIRDTTAGASITESVAWNSGSIVDDGLGSTIGSNQVNPSGLPDTSRTMATYMAALGYGTMSVDDAIIAFLTEARLQSKDNWRTEFTAAAVNSYMRAGFGVSEINAARLMLNA